MIVRLGYVALSKTLDITSSKTITYTEYLKNNNADKINKIIEDNLNNLYEILKYNVKNNIHFYRLSSKLIPLADIIKIDYIKKYNKMYEKLSTIINENNIRVDFHPDQFTILNSTKKEVVDNTFKILEYHYKLLNALKIKNKLIILHVGSSVFGKENSIKRFINNFKKLPVYIQNIIALENDDKVYNIDDILYISKILNIPIVLDIHHHNCNNKDSIQHYLKDVLESWKLDVPKIHFSSPKSKIKKEFRSHNDYINVDEFIDFLEIVKVYNKDIDIMLEAKAKDEALFKLVRLLKYKTNYKFIDETTFIV